MGTVEIPFRLPSSVRVEVVDGHHFILHVPVVPISADAHGQLEAAAKALGLSGRSLDEWCDGALELASEIEAMQILRRATRS